MRIQLSSGTAAELAVPATATRGVVIYPDIAGMRPLFDDLVARLSAEHGWAVAAIEPFPGQHLETIDERFDAVPRLDDERLLGDAELAADALTERSGASSVAVMGFCMGGMYALKAAAAPSRRFDRSVSFYGMIRLPVTWRGTRQAEPLDVLAGVSTPILAVIGGRDPYTPPEDVTALQAIGPNVVVVGYPDADHGFVHDPSRPAHRAEDAEDAWRRVVAFLS